MHFVFAAGCNISKTLRMLTSLNIMAITRQTFHLHQRKYLYPLLKTVWEEEKAEVLEEVRETAGTGLVLAGDGRADSPGHCAKYGTYTLIEETTRKVVDFQIVQVTFPITQGCYIFHGYLSLPVI